MKEEVDILVCQGSGCSNTLQILCCITYYIDVAKLLIYILAVRRLVEYVTEPRFYLQTWPPAAALSLHTLQTVWHH
jgi:hypothetical protein